MPRRKPAKSGSYRCLVGFNWGEDDERVEPGDVVELPPDVARTLREQGAIEEDD